jgi:peptidoglycan/xylan/chitin deacetylase (PgdA/CDA1 family)
MSATAAILVYHRIASVPVDPFHLCVPPQTFASHLRFLSDGSHVLSLDGLLARLWTGDVPRCAVALTFDDGYLDNLTVAAPLLDSLNLPATFFVTTAGLDRPHPYWWDRLADSILHSDRWPSAFTIPALRDEDAVTIAATDRFETLREIHRHIRPMSVDERNDAVDAVIEQCGPASSETARPMVGDEIQSLARHDGHRIGAHTVHHLSLPRQPVDVQRQELAESRSTLEQLLGREVRRVAYPFGERVKLTTRLAAEAGFNVGVTTETRAVCSSDQTLGLPRLEVTADTDLSAMLSRAFGEVG